MEGWRKEGEAKPQTGVLLWMYAMVKFVVKHVQPASFPEIISFFSRSWLFTSCLNAFLCYSSCFTSLIVVLFSMFYAFSFINACTYIASYCFFLIVLANYLSVIFCCDIIFRLDKAITKLSSPP